MIELVNYLFTFTIPAFKKVNFKSPYKGHTYYRAFGSLTQANQREFLDRILSDILIGRNIKSYWVYEAHSAADNRLHIHGILYNIDTQEMEDIRYNFYNCIGIKSTKKIDKISDIRISNNDNAWLEYLKKSPIKSKYEEEQIHFNALDSGIVKINDRLREQYFNSLASHLENEYLADEYLFGKSKNKYIVEL